MIWVPLPMMDSHVLNDALMYGTVMVAKVESFADGGPFYATAMTTDGHRFRSGPMKTHTDAAEWAEEMAGIKGLKNRLPF